MNTAIERKLNQFEQMIIGTINEKIDRKKAGLADYKAAEIAAKEQALAVEADAFYAMRTAQTADAVKHMISDAKMSAQDERLALKRRILAETVSALRARAEGFTQREHYHHFIESRLTAIRDPLSSAGQLVIHANDADHTWLKRLFEEAFSVRALSFKTLHPAQIGGVVVEIPEEHIRYNVTLQSIIDEKMDYISAKLYELLEEMEQRDDQ